MLRVSGASESRQCDLSPHRPWSVRSVGRKRWQRRCARLRAMRLNLLVGLLCREATRALLRHKLRSALTTLGIMIGIAAVVLVVAVGQAGAARARTSCRSSATTWCGSRRGRATSTACATAPTAPPRSPSRTPRPSAARCRSSSACRRRSTAPCSSSATARTGRRAFAAKRPTTWRSRSWDVALGASFTDDDVTETASKVLIGETVRKQLFGGDNPVGQMVHINGQLFEIVGVLAPKGQNADGRDQDDWLLMPFTTAAEEDPRPRLRLARRHPVLARCRPKRSIPPSTASSRSCAIATASAPARTTTSTSAGPTRSQGAARGGAHARALARDHRVDLAPGRRHRHHERHAGVGGAAHARDRRAPRRRRARRRRAAAVPRRGGDPQPSPAGCAAWRSPPPGGCCSRRRCRGRSPSRQRPCCSPSSPRPR